MKGNRSRLYWDACTWIAWNNDEFGIRPICSELLNDASLGKIEIVISPLVIAEFSPDTSEKFDLYLNNPFFIKVSITTNIGIRARKLVKKHSGLRGADALHLACALYANADYFFTTDGGILKLAGQIPGIAISQPEWPEGEERLVFPEIATTKE